MDAIVTMSFSEVLLAALGLTILYLLCTTLWRMTRPRKGPFAWPLVGAFPELMWNYHRYHVSCNLRLVCKNVV